MLGFSKLIKAIAQKPLVGHNCLTDVIRIYQSFVDELPKSYKTFKKVIHSTFPEIYDTKFMAFSSRRQFEDSGLDLDFPDLFRETSLSSLFQNTKKVRNIRAATFMYLPLIKHSELTPKYAQENADFSHEAGFDAFMSGCIFLQIAHLMAGMEIL